MILSEIYDITVTGLCLRFNHNLFNKLMDIDAIICWTFLVGSIVLSFFLSLHIITLLFLWVVVLFGTYLLFTITAIAVNLIYFIRGIKKKKPR